MFHIILPIVTGIAGTLFGVLIMALLVASARSERNVRGNIDADKGVSR